MKKKKVYDINLLTKINLRLLVYIPYFPFYLDITFIRDLTSCYVYIYDYYYHNMSFYRYSMVNKS